MSNFEIVSDFRMTGDQPRVVERVGGNHIGRGNEK